MGWFYFLFYYFIALIIKNLEKQNLIIDDYKELIYYLNNVSYYRIIESYNKPFLKNFNKNSNSYDYGVSFNSIKQLSIYDESISNIVFSGTKKVEQLFRYKLTLLISKKLWKIEEINEKTNLIKNVFNNSASKKEIYIF